MYKDGLLARIIADGILAQRKLLGDPDVYASDDKEYLQRLVDKGKQIEERCRETGRLGIIKNGERMGGREKVDKLLEVQK